MAVAGRFARMAYVDGVFSDRRSKRWALSLLGLAAGASFALGVARNATTVAPPPIPAVERVETPVYPKEAQPILQAEVTPAPPPVKTRLRAAPVERATTAEASAPIGEPAEIVAVAPAQVLEPTPAPDTPLRPPAPEDPPLLPRR